MYLDNKEEHKSPILKQTNQVKPHHSLHFTYKSKSPLLQPKY